MQLEKNLKFKKFMQFYEGIREMVDSKKRKKALSIWTIKICTRSALNRHFPSLLFPNFPAINLQALKWEITMLIGNVKF